MKATIAMASDHAGYEYKEVLKSYLESKGFQVEDFGIHFPAIPQSGILCDHPVSAVLEKLDPSSKTFRVLGL